MCTPIEGIAWGPVEHLSGVHQLEDQHRFEHLYRRWYRYVVRVCRQHLGSDHDAEAVAQEAFVSAWRSWRRYAEDRPFGPWVRAIAVRLCRRETMHAARRQSILARRVRDLPSSTDDGFDAAASGAGVERALRSLPHRARRLIVLRDVEGWSYEDIARMEGVAVETVRSGLRRGRAAFRAAYERTAGPPVVVVGLRPRPWHRARRFLEAVPWRVPSLEPVAAGMALLLAPAVPVAGVGAGPATAPVVAQAPGSPTLISPDVVEAGIVTTTTLAPVSSITTEAARVVEEVAAAGSEGFLYTFAVSPAYDEDRTVFALGNARMCQLDGCAVLLKSTDGGATWSPRRGEGLGAGQLLLPPDYPSDGRIFARTRTPIGIGDILVVSVDDGDTFMPIASGFGAASMSMAPLPTSGHPRVFIGANEYQAARVYDVESGKSEPLSLPLPPAVMPWHFAFHRDRATLASAPRVPGQWSVFRCDEAGCDDVLDVFMLEVGRHDQVRLSSAGPAEPDLVFAWTRWHLYRSVDGGRTFEAIERPGASEEVLAGLLFDVRGRVYARLRSPSATGSLHVSDDRGGTWRRLPMPEGWSPSELVVLPDGAMLAARFPGNGPTLVCSTDGGLTWESRCRRAA